MTYAQRHPRRTGLIMVSVFITLQLWMSGVLLSSPLLHNPPLIDGLLGQVLSISPFIGIIPAIPAFGWLMMKARKERSE